MPAFMAVIRDLKILHMPWSQPVVFTGLDQRSPNVEFLIESLVNEPSSAPTTVKYQPERVKSVSNVDQCHNITNHEFSRHEIYFNILKIF
ncbi:hypothetical protein AB4Y38_42610 [Paraburkholderia sp. EG285A]|uniref:hypothetical protein n=1 Tax=Paraburkholderia sp. EG285A TaxID=3237009 RepID=UPI0034D2B8B7